MSMSSESSFRLRQVTSSLRSSVEVLESAPSWATKSGTAVVGNRLIDYGMDLGHGYKDKESEMGLGDVRLKALSGVGDASRKNKSKSNPSLE